VATERGTGILDKAARPNLRARRFERDRACQQGRPELNLSPNLLKIHCA
jgi:hypothetical protein